MWIRFGIPSIRKRHTIAGWRCYKNQGEEEGWMDKVPAVQAGFTSVFPYFNLRKGQSGERAEGWAEILIAEIEKCWCHKYIRLKAPNADIAEKLLKFQPTSGLQGERVFLWNSREAVLDIWIKTLIIPSPPHPTRGSQQPVIPKNPHHRGKETQTAPGQIPKSPQRATQRKTRPDLLLTAEGRWLWQRLLQVPLDQREGIPGNVLKWVNEVEGIKDRCQCEPGEVRVFGWPDLGGAEPDSRAVEEG